MVIQMVGKRDFASGNGFADTVEQAVGNGSAAQKDDRSRPRPKIFKYQDAVNSAVEDSRREELKNHLLSGVNREGWENFRKSPEEVSLRSICLSSLLLMRCSR